MKSVMSFPERGKWGNNKYRGNTSGHVYRELIEQYIGKGNHGTFVDACMGGGTSRDVVADLFPNIEYHGLDLREGFDFTSMSILKQIQKEADIVSTHPPYANLLQYSSKMWGDKPHKADTSWCEPDEFIARSQVMLLNQRHATKNGGVYCTLIGDHRSKGVFRSYQADFIKMMPTNELKSVTIKLQHNCMSDSRQYAHMKHPAILHEYLLIWEKTKATMVQVIWAKASEMLAASKMTWRALIRMALMALGGKAKLSFIYDEVMKIAPEKMKGNTTWQATVRRTLQQHFENVERGVWTMA